MANVSKPLSIPNEEFSDDTTPSVARKFLNEVKSTIVTLQQAAKFVGDFKSLATEAGESLAKHKALELEIERLFRAFVSQDIMSVLFNKVSDQKETTRGTSANTKFAKQSILGKAPSSSISTVLPKVGETHALSKPVTSNLIPTPQE
nr:hypothetical protein [Tanacetum cinerariifolium]